MADFESWNQYSDFSAFVKRKARHVLDGKNRQFLDTVVETSAKRKILIKTDAVLWRAQLGHSCRTEPILDDREQEVGSYEVEEPFPPERMAPLRDRANEGRVNPKGIPCLYLSYDRDTAMTETRPWVGSGVSVAQFRMLKDLTVVDSSADSERQEFGPVYLDGEPEPGKREESVWWYINRAFSQPVTRSDDVAEYAPTQVLAEGFRSAGCDGIVYGSRLGSGKTVALFDLAAARLVSCRLHVVKAVAVEYSEPDKQYYIARGYIIEA